MVQKRYWVTYLLAFLLAVSCPAVSLAKSSKKAHSKSHSGSSTKEKKKKSFESSSESKSPLALGLDSVFIKMKADLDEVAGSPIVHSKAIPAVNNLFLKTLKAHQPFYSLTRVSKTGEVVNEMIRLVDNPNEKKQNLSKDPWFKYAIKKQTDYSGMIKLEETGRYYLLWATPIVEDKENSKGKEPFEGGLALKIDLWDSFHKFANRVETPFLIRIGRLRLYSNKWMDTIPSKEEALDVPGVKKIFVRYPKSATTLVAAPEPPAEPAIAAPAAPAIDSMKIKALQDSLKTVSLKKSKHKESVRNVIIAVFVVLIILIGVFIFIILPNMRQRSIMKDIENNSHG